jgi:quercetin dioxygenase-like cupin family protein
MKVTRPMPAFVDARGSITDLVQGEQIEAATLITTKAGAVRGNHWHAETIQWMYIVAGRLRYTAEVPGKRREVRDVTAGDLIVNEPMERHAMRALEDTTFLVLTRGPRSGADFESDTHRLQPSELLEHDDSPRS